MADLLDNQPIDAGEALGAPAIVPGVEAEVEGPLGSKLTLTVDDIPELGDLQVGDRLSFMIDDVTEDGNYALTVEPIPPAEEPTLGGQEAVLDELIG